MITLIVLSTLGQFRFQRQCVVQQQYYYQQYYQQPVAQFVAINDYDLVGQNERLNLSQEREAKIDKIINYIDSLKSKPIDNYPQKNQNYSNESIDDPPIKSSELNELVPPRPVSLNEQAPPPPVLGINDAPVNVTNIFKNSCVSCHVNKNNNLFTVDGKPNNLSPRQLMQIDFAVHSGRMPKKGGPLDNQSYTIIREWIGSHEDLIVSSLK